MNSTIQEYGTVKGLMFGCPSNRISSPIKINETISRKRFVFTNIQ